MRRKKPGPKSLLHLCINEYNMEKKTTVSIVDYCKFEFISVYSYDVSPSEKRKLFSMNIYNGQYPAREEAKE